MKTPAPSPVPFHVGVLAELMREKVKTELLTLLFALVALAALVSALVTGAKGPLIVALDPSGRSLKLEKLASTEYWDAHLQSFAMDFMALYFDKDPLAVKGLTEKALPMMTANLRDREQTKALNEMYNVLQTNTRVLNTVRSLDLDPQDRFTLHILAERTTRSLQKGQETEKKEIVRYRLHLAPEARSVENAFKGLRVRDFSVEVL